MFSLSTIIAEFIKWVVKPTLLENFQEEIDVEKDLRAIVIIVDDEISKDSKDTYMRYHTKVLKLKQRTTETEVNNRPPRFSQSNNVTSGSSSSHQAKSSQSFNVVFQVDQFLEDNYCTIHEEWHLDNPCPEWNQVMSTMASRLNDRFKASEKVQL